MGAKLGKVFKTIGKAAVTGFAIAGAAAAGIFVTAIKKAAEFEQSMAMVQSVTGATADEFAALEAKAKELGETSKFSMTDIADGMEFLGRAGFETNEIISAMDGVTALASSQVMDLGTAADITSNILTGMGLEAGEAGRVADVLAQTAASANVNVDMLGESFKYAAPLAAAAGWSVEETATAIGKMGDAGIQGSLAGTALRSAIADLIGESDNFKDKLGALGMEMDDLKGPDGQLLGMAEVMGVFEDKGLGAADMLTLFGKRAGPALAVLLEEGEEGLAGFTGELENAEGAAQRMADIQLDTLSGQFTILKGSLDLLFVTIGEDMLPILKKLLQDHIIPLINGMTNWIEKQGGILGIIDKTKTKIREWVDEHPVLISALQSTWDILKGLGSFLINVFQGDWSDAWADITGAAKDALELITDLVKAAWDALPIPDEMKTQIENTLTSIKDGAITAFNWIKEKALEAWAGIKASVEENGAGIIAAWDGLKEAGVALWDGLKEVFASINIAFGGTGESAISFRDIVKGVFDVILTAVTVAVTLLTGQLTIIKDAFKIVGDLLRGDWQQAWTDFKDYLKTVWDTIVQILDIIGLKDVITAGWEALRTKTVEIWSSIKDSISSIWDTIVSWFSGALQGLVDTVTGWMPGWMKKWLGVGEGAGDNLADGLTSKEGAVENAANVLADAITKPLAMTKETIEQIGKDLGDSLSLAIAGTEGDVKESAEIVGGSIADGLATGVLEGLPGVERSISNLNTSIDTTFTNFWDNRSPSRRMSQYGRDLAQGLANGVQEGGPAVIETISDLGDNVEYETQTFWGRVVDATREAWADMKSDSFDAAEDIADTLSETWDDAKSSIAGSLGDMLNNTVDYYQDEERATDEHTQSIWEILKEGVNNFLTSLRETLLLKAATHLVESIALAFIPGMQAVAAGHLAASLAYAAGGAGLAIAGFEEGVVFDKPTVVPTHMVAEGGYKEAYLPLSPSVFGEIGQGIVNALSVPTPTPTPALAGAGGIQVDMRGLYDGATITIRDDADITKIARETHDLWQSRMRGRGWDV